MKDPTILLVDILDSIRSIREYTSGLDLDGFLQDAKTQDAVIRRFEVMGEAARRTPESFQQAHVDIPWRRMAGLRNVLAHEYDDIALEILWDTLENRLDALERAVLAALESQGRHGGQS